VSAPWFAGRIDALARREVVADPVAAVRVIAECHDVRAGREQPLGELRRDPGAVGDVLAVDDARVGVELLAQGRETLLDSPAVPRRRRRRRGKRTLS